MATKGTSAWPAIALLAAFLVGAKISSDHHREQEHLAAQQAELQALDAAAQAPATSEVARDSLPTGYRAAGAPYGCTQDCSGHEAGYRWAEDNAVADPSDCGGNSQSFIEGCEAYAEEQQRSNEDAEQSEEQE